jgi:DNA-binding IclR family transcriptional regulator
MLADVEDLRDANRTTAIQKAVRLLQAIATSEVPRQLADLAEQVDMPKPSVHRLLAQLEEVGMIGRDITGKGFTVGGTLLRLAVDAMTVRAKQPAVHGIMRKLVNHVKESCNLGMLQDHEVIYLERVECDWPLRMQLQAGSRVPLHCTASGKLFLAQMSSRLRQRLLASLPLHKFTNNTIVDPELLEQECKAIKASGVSINREEYHLGLIGVAVPVRRSDQTVVATLSIHAPSFRMSVETALSYVPLLRNSAIEIAAEAGFE